MGDYGSSIIHFDESLESKSRLYGNKSHEGSGTLINKGNSLQDKNELDEAIQAYNQCLKILTKRKTQNKTINSHGKITCLEFD